MTTVNYIALVMFLLFKGNRIARQNLRGHRLTRPLRIILRWSANFSLDYVEFQRVRPPRKDLRATSFNGFFRNSRMILFL